MALLASSVLPSTLNIKVKQYEHRPSSSSSSSQFHSFPFRLNGHRRVSPECQMKITMSQFGEPNKVKEQLNVIKERLWENSPDSVKSFPWKKAENLLLENLVVAGMKALKWSIVTVFIFTCVSDFIYSISKNQELMIPFGLIAGLFMSDFIEETSQQAFNSSESEGKKGLEKWQLLAIGGLFVVFKFVSAYFAIRTRVFLLNVADGGLMQVLWPWIGLVAKDIGNLFSMKDDESLSPSGDVES